MLLKNLDTGSIITELIQRDGVVAGWHDEDNTYTIVVDLVKAGIKNRPYSGPHEGEIL